MAGESGSAAPAAPPPDGAGAGAAPVLCVGSGRPAASVWLGRLAGPSAGGGRPLSTAGGDGCRLDSLEPKVGSDSACVLEKEDGATAVPQPTSILNPRVVSKLSDDSGSGASKMSFDDILN